MKSSTVFVGSLLLVCGSVCGQQILQNFQQTQVCVNGQCRVQFGPLMNQQTLAQLQQLQMAIQQLYASMLPHRIIGISPTMSYPPSFSSPSFHPPISQSGMMHAPLDANIENPFAHTPNTVITPGRCASLISALAKLTAILAHDIAQNSPLADLRDSALSNLAGLVTTIRGKDLVSIEQAANAVQATLLILNQIDSNVHIANLSAVFNEVVNSLNLDCERLV